MPAPDRIVEVVGIDADDTLWHSEGYFVRTQRRYAEVVGRYGHDPDLAMNVLDEVQERNADRYGYGIKAFALNMVEAAIDATGGAIATEEVALLLAAARAQLDHPVHLLTGVDETITALADAGYRLVMVTKGDLHHQELKVAASGLADRFERIEIVSVKDAATYRRVVASMDVAPEQFAMVGNALRSDVLPVLAIGGHAAHIPYDIVWTHEHVEDPGEVDVLASITELPA